MGSLSDFFENVALDSIFGDNHNSALVGGIIQFALYTNDPGEAVSGTEVVGGGYDRVSVTNNTTNFPDAVGGVKTTGVNIMWPEATGTWGTVTHWAAFDADSTEMICYGTLGSSVDPDAGDVVWIPSGDLTIGAD